MDNKKEIVNSLDKLLDMIKNPNEKQKCRIGEIKELLNTIRKKEEKEESKCDGLEK